MCSRSQRQINVRTSPKLTARGQISIRFTSPSPAFTPPFNSIVIIPSKTSIWRLARSCGGWLGNLIHVGCVYKRCLDSHALEFFVEKIM